MKTCFQARALSYFTCMGHQLLLQKNACQTVILQLHWLQKPFLHLLLAAYHKAMCTDDNHSFSTHVTIFISLFKYIYPVIVKSCSTSKHKTKLRCWAKTLFEKYMAGRWVEIEISTNQLIYNGSKSITLCYFLALTNNSFATARQELVVTFSSCSF